MVDAPVNWGILGAAKIARELLCPAIHLSTEGRIAAIASRDPERARAMAVPYGEVTIHAGYEALLADPGVDAVYIPLANSDHVPWTLKALAAGKHVLCEKPMALKAEEIDQVAAAAEAAGRVVAEAFMVVHHPQWQRVKELLADEEVGPLRRVAATFSFFNEDPENIRNRADLAGGALRDIGVYPLIVTRFATGQEPTSVAASIDWDLGIDATARASLAFEGFTLDFLVSMRLAPYQEVVFHGTKGWIKVRTPFNAKRYGDEVVEVKVADRVTRLERFAMTEQYRAQVEAFHATVLTGAPFACPLALSRGNQAAIDAIYRAAETGERVPIS